MAEVTDLRNNALPYPVRAFPYGVVFPILDADGDLVTGAAGLDSEVSLNGDTFVDCTNEATEIASSSGMYYLLLTGAELTAQVVTILVKTSTTGAKTTPMVLYPRSLVGIRSGTAQGGSSNEIILDSGASALDSFYAGMFVAASIDGVDTCRLITAYVGSSRTATVNADYPVVPDNNDGFVVYLPEGVQLQQANTTAWLGTAVTAATAGIPDVNAKNINNVAATSVTTINANVGTTQPVNFTGTGASALVKSDMVDIAGAAVSTSTAQLGVNVVNWKGSAAATVDAAGYPVVTIKDGTGQGEIALTGGAVDTVTTVTVLTTAQAEPTAVPAANASPLGKIAWMGLLARNTITQTATQQKALADDATTVVGTSAVSDDGTTATRGEFA